MENDTYVWVNAEGGCLLEVLQKCRVLESSIEIFLQRDLAGALGSGDAV